MNALRIALAQINTTVGDFDGNCNVIAAYTAQAREMGAHLVAFPELAVTGYPTEDLVLRKSFVLESIDRLKSLASESERIVMVVGFVDCVGNTGAPAYNAAAVLANGHIAHVYHKIHLPNYGVFDEQRYFTPGERCAVLDLNGFKLGINVCEDVWTDQGPSEIQSANGAQIIVNINASPFEVGKHQTRMDIIRNLAIRNSVFAIYTNQVGGQDELVFDGTSLVIAPNGNLVAQAKRFEEDLLVVDLDRGTIDSARAQAHKTLETKQKFTHIKAPLNIQLPPIENRFRPLISTPAKTTDLIVEEEVYRALVLGTRDYASKTGFNKAIIGLSGGIDSTLTAVIAVDALSAKNVVVVSMPSRHSSKGSVVDAAELAKRLSIDLWHIPIEPAHSAFEGMLAEHFSGTRPNIAEENIQSRIRGNIIMALSNKFGWLVLTTGNKSEMATGYATLYGDMAGGFSVLKDVPKTLVYRLANFRNRTGHGTPIPSTVIEKPPSAELRPNQLDQDSLPPYEILDHILDLYVERNYSFEEICSAEIGVNPRVANKSTIRHVLDLIDRNEYKRRQSPPGIKVTGLAFGRDRRLPIASRYKSD